MEKQTHTFSNSVVDYYLNATFQLLHEVTDINNTVLITDEHVFKVHEQKFKGWNTIVLMPGEQYKAQATVDSIILQLIELGAHRQTTLVGVGGGVITDLTGYVASVYMRGVRFGFIPTSILAMVDASIGGKNGIDVGVYKNMVGVIRQPSFLLYDTQLLHTLPQKEWENGFAEIIKHACIKDAELFSELEIHSIDYYKNNNEVLNELIKRNVLIKTKVVQNDEFEAGERKLLNFGHTLGHAIENKYHLLHGHAVSIGMVAAATISEEINQFHSTEKERLIKVLMQYGLPVKLNYDKKKAFETLLKDKKKEKDVMNYVLLKKIGEAEVVSISLVQLQDLFSQTL